MKTRLLSFALIFFASAVVIAQPAGKVFRAGAAMANTTPLLGTPMEGVISKVGPATFLHDDLHAKALVLDDGTTRFAFVICDNTMISREVMDRAKVLTQQATGLATNRILISATHTHSAPRALVGFLDNPLHQWYLDFLAHRIADSVQCAVSNLAPAKIGWGSGQKPEHVFNRRWVMTPDAKIRNPFGEKTDEKVVMNPADREHLLRPSGPVDPEVFVVSVQYADGRPLAVLANYGLHYVGDTGEGHISADYFGMFSEKIKELLGAEKNNPEFVGIMSNGTSGDVNGIDFSQPRQSGPAYSKIKAVAFSVAEEAKRVCDGIKYKDWVSLAVVESEIELGVRKPSEARIKWAQSEDPKRTYVRETLELAKYPDKVPVKLQAIRIGDLGIAAIPCEVFAATGLEIKKLSPFKSTFTIELANGYNGYLPTPEQHELGGYETWEGRNAYVEEQGSEKIKAEILRLLKELVADGTLKK